MGALLISFGFGQFGDGLGPKTKWMVDQVCFASADLAAEAMDKGNHTALVMGYRSLTLTNYHSGADDKRMSAMRAATAETAKLDFGCPLWADERSEGSLLMEIRSRLPYQNCEAQLTEIVLDSLTG